MLTRSNTDADILPSFCHARVLILGVGNMLFGDDGFGPQVIEHLCRHYTFPADVCAMDVGTGARKVLFTLALSEARPDILVIVDAVDWGNKLGDVLEIPVERLPRTKVDDFSLHQVPTSNLLRELQDECSVQVTVLVCDVGQVPQVIAPGLSPDIELAVASASEMIADRYGLSPV